MSLSTVTKSDESLAIEDAQVDVPDYFTKNFRGSLSNPLLSVPDEFVTWIADRIAVLGLNIPIGQIVGANNFNVVAAPFILTEETTTSSTFDDLTTTGPSLAGLPDGKYVIQFGCAAWIADSGDEADMSLEVNSTAASSDDACISQATGLVSVSMTVVKTLDEGNNSLTAKYLALDGTGTAHFARRWMIAQKYANL